MSSTTRLGVVAATASVLVVLSGCTNPVSWLSGSNAIDDYCGDLSSHQVQFADMFAAGTPDALLKNLPMLEQIAGKAPSDIVDDWQSFLTPVQGLAKALESAGIRPDDYHDGLPPAGTSSAVRQQIARAAALLATPSATSAASSIDQQARDVCKLNLGM
jgi:hypothetical protein